MSNDTYPSMPNEFIVDHVSAGIFSVDRDMNIRLWNRFMEINSGKKSDEVIGKNLFACFPELPKKWLTRKIESVFILGGFAFTNWEHRPYLFKFAHHRPITSDIEYMLQNSTFMPVKTEKGEVHQVCITIFDATDTGIYQSKLLKINAEQQRLIEKLEETKNQLLQAEKMAAIGQLAAGVAHEINNPVGFVASNLSTLRTYVNNVLLLLNQYEAAESHLPDDALAKSELQATKEAVDLTYLKEDLVDLLNESDDGVKRVKQIVQDLKEFSRVDQGEWEYADLHKGIDSTLNVVANELKYKATVVKEYGEIPAVECMLSQINQVFMNLFVNAAQAIEHKGEITIRTRVQDDMVRVEVSDTGAGINPEHLNRIFEPFFTTKPVGAGTGLGLSVSFGIIKKHNGRVEVDSETGKGTTFRIWLPIKRKISDDATANHDQEPKDAGATAH